SGEIASLEVLHHQVWSAVRERSDVGDARDVLALDADRCSRFAGEPSNRFAILERVRQEELDRHPSIELFVASSDHDTHAPGAEDALHSVLAGDDVAFADSRDDMKRFAHAGCLSSGPSHGEPSSTARI